MAKKFELVSGTGATLDIAHTIGLTVVALLTALAEQSPEVLASMRRYLLDVQRRANTLNASDKQKRTVQEALRLVSEAFSIQRRK